MSAPPTGGPQPPPQQYPAQQAPPPYQQYPPQQPYYQQPPQPPKKSNTALIIVLVIVVVIVVLALIAYWAFLMFMQPINTATQVTVTGVSFVISYPGATQYFGPSPITACSACPIHTSVMTQFQYTLTLTNSDSTSHEVTDISLAGYTFTLVSTAPTVSSSSPLVVGAGGTGSVILTVQPSTFGGSFTLSGTLTTS